MDRVACDLAAELVERQGGADWKDEYGEHEVLDPWRQIR
jgi:hypothetical protein